MGQRERTARASLHRSDHWASSQRKHYEKGGIGSWFRRYRDQKIFRLLKGEGHRVIDLGCGEGITLEAMIKTFPRTRCLGIELDRENTKTCHSLDLPVLNGSIYDLSIRSGSTDDCLLTDVLEHLEDPEKALREIRRILKPGGKLIIIIPNDRNFFWSRLLCLKWKEAFHDSGHVRQWRPKAMEILLKKTGFHVTYRGNIPLWMWSLSLYHMIQAEKRPTGEDRVEGDPMERSFSVGKGR
jgi:SAM-dependent methyltransferase